MYIRMYESPDTQNVGIINNIKKGLYTQGCMYMHHVYFILILNKINILPNCFFMQWKLTLGRNLLVNYEITACCHDKADNKKSLLTNMPPK